MSSNFILWVVANFDDLEELGTHVVLCERWVDEGRSLRGVSRLLKVKCIPRTVYPMVGEGQEEGFNCTLGSILRKACSW